MNRELAYYDMAILSGLALLAVGIYILGVYVGMEIAELALPRYINLRVPDEKTLD